MKKILTILFSTILFIPAVHAVSTVADAEKITSTTGVVPESTEKMRKDLAKDLANDKEETDKNEKPGVLKRLFSGKDDSNTENDSLIDNSEKSDKVSELEANAQAMRDKENSTENKLLGAASIGATGIGGSQLAQGLSEQKSDKDAETDMKAYLATFKCDYGQGQNINGGEKSITLPGGNVLMPMYTEYKTLADELKNTKTALGMAPGIESETILDKSTTGLYEYDQAERKAGSFASVSASLTGAAGGDAWDTQKAAAANKVTTGALVAGAGIVGGIAGNMLINKNSAQESSDEINEKYAKIASAAQKIQASIDKTTSAKIACVDGATGTYPNCDCGTNRIYSSESNTCVNKPTITCGSEHMFASENNTCQCGDGYELENGKCICGYTVQDDGSCAINQVKISNNTNLVSNVSSVLPTGSINLSQLNTATPTKIAEIKFPSASFAPNEYNVKDDYKNSLDNEDLDPDVCYLVSGNTDLTGTKSVNEKLSLQRADSVKQILISRDIPESNIKTVGNGWKNCKSSKMSDSSCRNVTVEIMSSCQG